MFKFHVLKRQQENVNGGNYINVTSCVNILEIVELLNTENVSTCSCVLVYIDVEF